MRLGREKLDEVVFLFLLFSSLVWFDKVFYLETALEFCHFCGFLSNPSRKSKKKVPFHSPGAGEVRAQFSKGFLGISK